MTSHLARGVGSALAIFAFLTMVAVPVEAQQPQGTSPPSRVSITGGIDFLNAYFFRGIRQDDTGLITWPSVEIGVGLYSGNGVLKNVTVHGGTWNSLHTGIAGTDGPSGEHWYESDVRTGINFALAGMLIDTSYVNYNSPNSMFTTVNELMLGIAADDRMAIAGIPIRPYLIAAFELDTRVGAGQADGGFDAGKYLELGAAPALTFGAFQIAVPVKMGLSLGNYYELAGTDHVFGYASVSGVMTVPIGRRTRMGGWNIHGGVQYQTLGETTRVFNDNERTAVIGSIGMGWSR